ncbi:8-amino-7-oxononanoate synthase [Pedobacter sp. L105]|uniref:aminotransferase class I/II-fold pyridoxal phosphate-dependent enzyme n=1 Tax=Pedobacter sp. L105 TaxID=1641871 RepID=UPI00131C4681|nr:8-amino-7-oxononanoate synthase [Pedobacter sp. L105]
MNNSAINAMQSKLKAREAEGTRRNLQPKNNLYDFSSNDYLGFARSVELQQNISEELKKHPQALLGATGSRLLSGNSAFAEELEKELATYHQAENGLIFNSGYAANTALFSCIPQKGDTIIHDEYIHASVIDGARLSFARRFKFRHNDLEDLEHKIKQSTGNCFVAVESVYSMDGDLADLLHIAQLCRQHGVHLIVDEAHAFGVLGTGLVDLLHIHNSVFARVVTFGKALGVHGAIVLGSELLRDYLVNFARPFIYSTAPSFAHLLTIQQAYHHLLIHPEYRAILQEKSTLLKEFMPPQEQLHSTTNPSAIQCVFLKSNHETLRYSRELQKRGFDIHPVRSPTVPRGTERLRLCVHLHNSDYEILELCHHLDLLSKYHHHAN